MKKFSIQVIVLLIVIFGALAIYTSKLPGVSLFPQTQRLGQVKVGETLVKVEVADTADERKKGLGGRESLATDSGMLFIYPTADKYIFWMKGVKFPLDFIWIADNQVVDIIKNAPAPAKETPDDQLLRYAPTQPVDKILEVNGGFVEQQGIKIGDKVEVIN